MPSFTVKGHVVGKGRPRFVKRTGHAYTPDTTVEAENAIAAAWLALGLPPAPKGGAVAVSIEAFLMRPKSHYGTGKRAEFLKESAPVWPTGKPDGDNLAKTVKDALNGLAWHDDSQVVSLLVEKKYSCEPYSYWRVDLRDYPNCVRE